MKILFVTTVPFLNLQNGSGVYTRYVFNLLRGMGEVDQFVIDERKSFFLRICYAGLALLMLPFVKLPLSYLYYRCVGSLFSSLSDVKKSSYDLVVFDHLESCVLSQYFDIPKVLISHNDETLVAKMKERSSCLGRRIHRKNTVRAFQDYILENFDAVVAISRLEKERFSEKGKSVFHVVPKFPSRACFIPHASNVRVKIGFIGSGRWVGNVDVLRLIVETYLPKLQFPFNLVIAGDGWERVEFLQRPEVQMMGFVESLSDFYSAVDMTICPVAVGAGVNIKILESLSYGRPCLTNMLAAESITSPDNFAASGLILMDDGNIGCESLFSENDSFFERIQDEEKIFVDYLASAL